MKYQIDWKIVNANLRCPICGDKASIEPGSDGYEGSHTHRFHVSRLDAQRISEQHQTSRQRLENILPALTDEEIVAAISAIKSVRDINEEEDDVNSCTRPVSNDTRG